MRIAITAWWAGVLGVAAMAEGQVVQLPTFHFFSIQTTVSVPDRGWSVTGGSGRARSQQAARGAAGASHLPWANRLMTTGGRASELRLSGAAASATIHDPAAAEKELLAGGGGTPSERDAAIERQAAFLAGHVVTRRPGGEIQSVRAIRARQEAEQQRAEQEIAAYLARARAAEAAGRWGAARASYLVVVRRASGTLKQEAQSRLDALADRHR